MPPSAKTAKHTIQIRDTKGATVSAVLVDPITIGRDPNNAVTLPSRNVSRRHARIFVDAGGEVTIEDLGSYNGVRINGMRIDAPTPIGPGDRVHIGDYLLWVEIEGGRDTRPHDAPTVRIAKEDLP